MSVTTRYEHGREVLYISNPPRPNGWGIAGFVVSLVSIATLGLLSPLALLFSLIGMRRAPRGFAVAGTAISLGLMAPWAGLAYLAHQEHQEHLADRNRAVAMPAIVRAREAIDGYLKEHDRLPGDVEAARLMIDAKVVDAWGEEIYYSSSYDRWSAPEPARYALRSFGPDRRPHTPDDVAVIVDGSELHAPIGASPVDEPGGCDEDRPPSRERLRHPRHGEL